MQFLRIVLASLALAILYGVVHDQLTVRVSLEYFTIGHPPVFATSSPTLLALGWGVIATWWVGLPLGFVLAAVARNGRTRAPLQLEDLVPRLLMLLAAMAVAATFAGLATYAGADVLGLQLPEPLATRVPSGGHRAFLAAWAAHAASYAVGIGGALVLIATVAIQRRRRARGTASSSELAGR